MQRTYLPPYDLVCARTHTRVFPLLIVRAQLRRDAWSTDARVMDHPPFDASAAAAAAASSSSSSSPDAVVAVYDPGTLRVSVSHIVAFLPVSVLCTLTLLVFSRAMYCSGQFPHPR
jgi:hypothetical protein